MSWYTDSVTEFHLKMGLPLNEYTVDDTFKRARLMAEELGELAIALDEKDLVKVADAMADFIYVVAGTAVNMGIPHNANFGVTGDCAPRLPDITTAMWHLQRMMIDLGFTVEAMRTNNRVNVGRFLDSLTYKTFELAREMELPFDELFAEVHRSNMTKTPLDKHKKGGKGDGYTPPDLDSILLVK